MNLLENIRIALEGLRLNKMRTLLTMLGIIIGISSVIAIITVGDALSKSVAQGFDSIASNLIQVYVKPRKDSGLDWGDMSERDYFPLEIVDQIKEVFGSRISEIEISGASASGSVTKGKQTADVNILGSSPGGQKVAKVKMINGRFLEDSDISQSREVAVISDKVVKKIYEGKIENALGSQIEVKILGSIYTYTVVGIYKHEPISFGIMGGENPDGPTTLYTPYTVANRQFWKERSDLNKISDLYLVGSDTEDNEALKTDVQNFINNGYYRDNTRVEVEAYSIASDISQINEVMNTMKLAIGGIAAISLLVGGIGVMNILLVSVTERTREIGIRKALGATNGDIQGQFIIESVIICIIGGMIGIILGGAGGYGLSKLMESPTLPSIQAVVIATGFSMFIGIFFGFYPASKAAKLNPIDALRHE